MYGGVQSAVSLQLTCRCRRQARGDRRYAEDRRHLERSQAALPGWLGRVDCLLLAVGGWIFLATASLNSTAVASSKCSLAQRSSTHCHSISSAPRANLYR